MSCATLGRIVDGWGTRIRTWECQDQNLVPYRLAIPHPGILLLIVLRWLGYQDSNLGMPGSKPGALPLGDTPILNSMLPRRKMVRETRLELAHLAAPEPKSGASTNFATPANNGGYDGIRTCDPNIMSVVL